MGVLWALRTCLRDMSITASQQRSINLYGSLIALLGSQKIQKCRIHDVRSTAEVGNEPIDLDRQTATELVWPMSKYQQKYAARVSKALAVVLTEDTKLREALVEDAGVSIKDLRPSPDHSKVFILWNTYKDDGYRAERLIEKHSSRLRSLLSKALKARTVPKLEFRRDIFAEEIELLEETLDNIEKQLKDEKIH